MPQNRKTVRIFVSSTFKDMDVERDNLRNYVIPLLNDRLRGANVHVQLVDLRHSIETSRLQSEEEREKMIFDICMDEIKACRPFFIGLVGHRYGWIPDKGIENVALPDGFPLGKNEISVTTHEFLNGPILKGPDDHSLVFIRDRRSYDNLSDAEKAMHIESGENARRVEALRSYLQGRTDIHSESYCLDLASPGSKEWEAWGNNIANRIADIIRNETGLDVADSAEADTFMKANLRFAQYLTDRFVGRKELVDFCLKYFLDRQSIYLQDVEPGMGSSSLLCKLYTLLSGNPSYLCLFNAPEASAAGYSYGEVLYYWNLELCSFLNLDKDIVMTKRGDSSALFHTFCELALKIVETTGRKVVLFTDKACEMDGYFPLRQHFTLWAQTMHAGDEESANIIGATPVGELDADTFLLITKGIRSSVSQALWAKHSARNVRWLSLAVNILESLNKIDYLEIRSTETKGNEERNITAYLESIVEDMPDDYIDLAVFWTGRLRHVLGSEFIDSYLGSLAICHSLTDEDLAAITGRSVAWCAWFRHMLGHSIVKAGDDGAVTINDDLREDILKDIHSGRAAIAAGIHTHLSALPDDDPSRVNNIFAVNLELRNYPELLGYISDSANYTDYVGDSPAIMAFMRLASNDTNEYIKVVEELVAQANPDADSFNGLCRWCGAVLSEHKFRLFIRTCMLMLNRLVDLYNNGSLSSSGQLALASISYHMGGAFVEVDDGEEQWNQANANAMMICRKHINESPQWNALYTTVMYDRYEGFTQIDERWKFLSREFRPIAYSDFAWLPTSDFAGYMRLLRDMAILDTRFDIERDSSVHALKALDVATAIWEDSLSTGSWITDHYNGMYEMLFCSMALLKQCRETGHPDFSTAVARVKAVLDHAFGHAGKNTKMTSTAVMMAHVTYLYAEMLASRDAAAAVAAIDRMLDLLVHSDTPDSVGVEFMSQGQIHYQIIRQGLCRTNGRIDYMSVAFAWCIAARIVLDARINEGIGNMSKYPAYDDDIEIFTRMLQCEDKDNLWDRELDPTFVAATAAYGKILSMIKIGKVPAEELKFYMRLFFNLSQKAAPHYRYADRLQFAMVSSVRERTGIDLNDEKKTDDEGNEREPMTADELENMIDRGEYDAIILKLGQQKEGTPTEIFYLALAYLRAGRAELAARYFEFLSGLDIDDNNLTIASVINRLYALLAAGMRQDFAQAYGSLPDDLRDDSDIAMLHRAYSQAIATPGGKISLPTPYGFTL